MTMLRSRKDASLSMASRSTALLCDRTYKGFDQDTVSIIHYITAITQSSQEWPLTLHQILIEQHNFAILIGWIHVAIAFRALQIKLIGYVAAIEEILHDQQWLFHKAAVGTKQTRIRIECKNTWTTTYSFFLTLTLKTPKILASSVGCCSCWHLAMYSKYSGANCSKIFMSFLSISLRTKRSSAN